MMNKRRTVLKSMLGLAAGSVATAAKGAASAKDDEKPASKSFLNQRSYSGKMIYSHEAGDEWGREFFTVTIQPNGLRTLRAMVEQGDRQILRDVIATVDIDWNPLTAFEQMTTKQEFQGATWYHFTDRLAECEGLTVQDGRFSQKFAVDHQIAGFGTHPLHSDTWTFARIRQARAKVADPAKKPMTDFTGFDFTTSASMDGVGGPRLEHSLPAPGVPPFVKISYIGPEKTTVKAGTFNTEHFQFYVIPTKDTLDSWVFGDDCIPILETSSVRKARYELVELTGDPR